MKSAGKLMVILVGAAAATIFFVSIADAKSVKWYCVALDPATPWVQTCRPSTYRP